jgi:hypothetical protein
LPCPDIEIGLRHPVRHHCPGPARRNVIYFTIGAKSLRRASWGRAAWLDPGRGSVTPPHASCDRGDDRGLQIGGGRRDLGNGFGQNFGRDIADRGIDDFVNETDVLVLAGSHPRDDFTPGDLGIDHGLASATAVVDHYDKILHGLSVIPTEQTISKIRNKSIAKFRKSEIWSAGGRIGPGRARISRVHFALTDLRDRAAALARNRAI